MHEVIRLSGMNLVINDMDMPLIIKVASIPRESMQVYFIDNEEYFKRKPLLLMKMANFSLIMMKGPFSLQRAWLKRLKN